MCRPVCSLLLTKSSWDRPHGKSGRKWMDGIMCSTSNGALCICFEFKDFAKMHRCYQSILQPPTQPQCESSHSVHNISADSQTHTRTYKNTPNYVCMLVDAVRQLHTNTPTIHPYLKQYKNNQSFL